MKTYTISKIHNGNVHQTSGTLEELIEYFGYTLECGHSWNHKLQLKPKTIKSLVSTLNKCVAETSRSYDPDYYELAS